MYIFPKTVGVAICILEDCCATKEQFVPKVPVISIVDDDASVRFAISRLVRAVGYAAQAFSSADEFLNSRQVDETSCVITDVQMPGTSGIELQDLLRSHGYSMPMIFITAFPDENSRAKVLKAGAVSYLTKPFDAGALVECIDRAVGSAKC